MATTMTVVDKLRAVERELALRKNVYAAQVRANKLAPHVAAHEIAVMEAIAADYRSARHRERYKHVKRGSICRVIALGTVQTDTPLHDNDHVQIYREEDGGDWYVRPPSEFNDGRFTLLSAEGD